MLRPERQFFSLLSSLLLLRWRSAAVEGAEEQEGASLREAEGLADSAEGCLAKEAAIRARLAMAVTLAPSEMAE